MENVPESVFETISNDVLAIKVMKAFIDGRLVYLSPLNDTIDWYDSETNPDGINNLIIDITILVPTNE